VTTANIHATSNPVVQNFPSYTLTKLAGTVFFQFIAQEIPQEKIQVVSYHPGVIHNEAWAAMNVGPEHCDAGKFIPYMILGFLDQVADTCRIRQSPRLFRRLGCEQGSGVLARTHCLGFVGCGGAGDWRGEEAD
jgi:NAD(P)-dependent dehydrogenase (short-subunit alcohol dehydrogenase family)